MAEHQQQGPAHPYPDEELELMRAEFEAKMKEYTAKCADCVKKPWTSAMIHDAVRDILASRGLKKKSSRQYGLVKKYETLEVGLRTFLIRKRNKEEDPLIIIVPVEEFFDNLVQYHLQTNHGGRDKMSNALKNNFYIPRPAIELFISLCKTCSQKRVLTRKNLADRNGVVGFKGASRGHFDLIDFQENPCEDYMFLMQFQYVSNTYFLLRPLKSNSPREIADELLKIFVDFGAPCILQSNLDRQITAAVVLMISMQWPECRVVHAASQDSTKSTHVKKLLQDWMEETQNSDWAFGCRFVQWRLNTTENPTFGKTPFQLLFGSDPKLGMACLDIPTNVYSLISTEEDLQKIIGGENVNEPIPLEIVHENVGSNWEKLTCQVCSELMFDEVTCSRCSHKVHPTCCAREGTVRAVCNNCKQEEMTFEETWKQEPEEVTECQSEDEQTDEDPAKKIKLE